MRYLLSTGGLLRVATTTDFATIAALYNSHIAAGKSTMEERQYSAEAIADWVTAMGDREGLFVYEEENQVLGWGIIKKYSPREGYRFAAETAVYLHESALRKGIGTAIKLQLMEICREWRYHHLVAKIFASNEGSIAYNLKLGYTLVGIQKEIGFKNGQWQDVAILQCIL